jgi:hypothetical protein
LLRSCLPSKSRRPSRRVGGSMGYEEQVRKSCRLTSREPCGCQWWCGTVQIAGIINSGDHLLECLAHKKGVPHSGSVPDDRILNHLCGVLRAGGFTVAGVVSSEEDRGVAGRRPFLD